MRFIPAVALESVGVKLPFTIPGDVDILEPTSGGDQIARVVTIAVPFAAAGCSLPSRLQ
jgi:hypothetical protein